jgi:O-antigen ligase
VLIVGFLAATLIASHAVESRLLRGCAAVVAVASVYAVYLTHTRAVWLAFALVVLLGAVAGRGFRSGFVLTLGVMVLVVATNWSTFTSSDRSAGGVGSAGEVQDRLNTLATSSWAFEQKPLIGWGIGRFAAVNTYHHQQYSPEIPWQRGFGIASHLDALGILVELGIIGLAFWMVALVLIYTRLVCATRQLPAGGMYGRPLGLTALFCLVAQSTTGLTVDLRFFDFPNIIVMLLAGAAIGWQSEQARRSAGCHAAHDPQVSSMSHSPAREAVQ